MKMNGELPNYAIKQESTKNMGLLTLLWVELIPDMPFYAELTRHFSNLSSPFLRAQER
jgi:hypothetical protein